MHNYLKKILIEKRKEVDQLQLEISAGKRKALLKIDQEQYLPRKLLSFQQALVKPDLSVIAEIKRKSPSKNHLADIADPVALAKRYHAGGAAAISVLTDQYGFNGSLEDLKKIRAALGDNIAILRKDFLIEPIQIAESIEAGADAILLIVAVLQDKTQLMLDKAKQLGIDALVEVHNQAELDIAIDINADIIGVNNRNLTSFEVNINNAKNLVNNIPNKKIKIAESGIHTIDVAQSFAEQGFDAVLVGEALVKSEDPKSFIQKLSNSDIIS